MLRKILGMGMVVAVLLGPAAGVAGAQTDEPALPSGAVCGGEDPLAALPAELAPLTDLLGTLVTTICEAAPQSGGALPALPEMPGAPGGGEAPGTGGIPILGEVLAPLCDLGTSGLAALPEALAPVGDVLGTLVGALCGDTAAPPSGSPLDAFCDPTADPFGALPEQLAPLTDLLGGLLDTLCSLVPGPDGGTEAGGDDGGDPAGAETAPSEPTVGGDLVSASAGLGPRLPDTGGSAAPLVAAGAVLGLLALALRVARTRIG